MYEVLCQYYAKETKFNHTTLQNSLNDQEVKILPMKLVKLKTFRMSNKQQEEIEQLERDHSMVVTEASSCSA